MVEDVIASTIEGGLSAKLMLIELSQSYTDSGRKVKRILDKRIIWEINPLK